ncbi:MAG: 2-amino-4-hydroxy-6-hydroxymethyldihydropteridine diphosphokinase [Pseudomonadota bacterium]|jgi:2-amino-4-hydroxy-6-hydroxymethyldihydropteridine diphosphokinase
MSQYKWIFQYGFPFSQKTDHKKNKVLIGIGGNLKNPLKTFKLLFKKLRNYPNIRIYKTSPILKNPPFGYTNQPDFYNALIWIQTTFAPLQLLNRLQFLEKSFGRKRSFANAPRTLDLDLIFFENIMLYNKRLILPHPSFRERKSVLAPLALMSIRRKWRV